MNWKDLIKSSDAKSLLPMLSPVAKKTLQYLAGDYWQGMEAWAGTRPPLDAANRADVEAELARMFVPQPLIEEATQRHADGVVGHEPSWEYLISRDRSHEEEIVEAKRRVDDYLEKVGTSIRAKQEAEASQPVLIFLLRELVRDAKALLGIERERPPQLGDLPEEVQRLWLQGEELERLHEEEDKQVSETNAVVGAWWDARKAHETTYEFTWQLVGTGRACMRFFVPSGLLNENGQLPKGTDWKGALNAIFLECPAPESAGVVFDRSTMRSVSIFVYREKWKNAEGKEEEAERVEISFVDDDGQTVIRILQEDVIIEGGEAIEDIGGELYVDMAEMSPLITDPVQRLNNAGNLANSMTAKNADLAGFRERNFFNVKRPQMKVIDTNEPSGFRWEDAPHEVGSDAANFNVGVTYRDQDGNERIAQGTLIITDPVSPEPLITAVERFERCFYQAVSQLHVLISGDATASAVSRVQARADFVTSLMKTKPKVEGVLRSRLRGVLLLAAYLSNADGREAILENFKGLRVRVDCRLDAGPMTPEEKQALIQLVNARLMARETAQTMIGTEDLNAENAAIEDDRTGSQDYQLKRAQVFSAMVASARVPVEAAALISGFSEEEARTLAEAAGPDDGQPQEDETAQ